MNYTGVYTNKREIKIPTIFSFLLVGFVIFLIGRFFLNTVNFSTASRREVGRVEVSNVFPTQVTVFWQTIQKKPAWIVFGTSENKLDRIAIDKKDGEKNRKPYKNHYMVLQNLEENRRYFFKFVVDNKLISKEDGGPFTFTTISSKIGVNNLQPAYGKIIDQKGKPIENAVVFLYVKDAYSLSALSKNSGEWLIPLNYIINKISKKLKTPAKEEVLKLQVIDEEGKNSNIVATLTNISPVTETVVVGKDYDLLQKKDVLSATSNSNQVSTIDITFPRENATIPGGNPLIKGKAIAGNIITIRVGDSRSATFMQSKADGKGAWQVALPQRLSTGSHQITLQTKDASGNNLSKTRTFTIAKSGEQVLGEASGSATPTVTFTPTTTTIPTTPAPTENLTPTIPVSGANITYVGLSSAALVLLGLGLLILF